MFANFFTNQPSWVQVAVLILATTINFGNPLASTRGIIGRCLFAPNNVSDDRIQNGLQTCENRTVEGFRRLRRLNKTLAEQIDFLVKSPYFLEKLVTKHCETLGTGDML